MEVKGVAFDNRRRSRPYSMTKTIGKKVIKFYFATEGEAKEQYDTEWFTRSYGRKKTARLYHRMVCNIALPDCDQIAVLLQMWRKLGRSSL